MTVERRRAVAESGPPPRERMRSGASSRVFKRKRLLCYYATSESDVLLLICSAWKRSISSLGPVVGHVKTRGQRLIQILHPLLCAVGGAAKEDLSDGGGTDIELTVTSPHTPGRCIETCQKAGFTDSLTVSTWIR
jgi:hypothetical protein